MKKKQITAEIIIRFWPVLAFLVSLVGAYFTVKFTMSDHDKRIVKLEDGRKAMWEKIGDLKERTARLEGERRHP